MLVGLTVHTGQCLLEIFKPPNETLEVFVLEEEFVLFHELFGAQLHVFVKQVDF